MKNLKSFLIVAVAIFAFACSQKPAVDYTLISGTLENYSSGDLMVAGNDRSEVIISVASDGTFADTLYKEEILYLVFGKTAAKIYASNGTVLNITADAKDFSNSIAISGEKSDMSNYLQAKGKIEKTAQAQMKELFAKGETEFMAAMKQQLVDQQAELNKFLGISEEVKSLEKRSLKASFITSLINYPSYHVYFGKDKNYEASEEFLSATKDFDYNDGELYEYSQDYQRLLVSDSYNKAAKMVDAGEASSPEMGNLLVAEKIENETIREAMLFNAVANSFARAENGKELFEKYNELAKDEEKRATISEKYNTVSKLDTGKPSPKFTDYENYAGGTSSLDDFKGKYVYIDVWATWCGPCKAEIPHLQKVEEKYHGKNIEFVSISVDKDKDKQAWRDMVADKQMGGVQLISTDKENKFMEDYAISGIPRFILIDPEGNIVKKNAPRPSDEKLIELFNELGI